MVLFCIKLCSCSAKDNNAEKAYCPTAVALHPGAALKAIAGGREINRQPFKGSIGDESRILSEIYYAMPVLPVFDFCSTLFLSYLIVLRQLFLKIAPAVLGRRDRSIRALRKRRSRNETDNFIESISQMVPKGPQMVPTWRLSKKIFFGI